MSNQYLKLRRSSIPNKTPDTGSLDFGELALNTYDGLIFMKKSGSSGEEIIRVAGGNSFSGSFSGSFYGDGSGLTNVKSTVPFQIASGSITASVDINTLFLVKSSSIEFLTITQNQTTLRSNIFLINNSANIPIFKVSESIVYIPTQSVQLSNPVSAGGIYFTSDSFFVSLDS